jgi:hypothetical protein
LQKGEWCASFKWSSDDDDDDDDDDDADHQSDELDTMANDEHTNKRAAVTVTANTGRRSAKRLVHLRDMQGR